MGFVELFVVFILIGNIDVATCSKGGLAFLTGKAAALDVNITACRDRDILFACNIGSFYLFIHYLVMVLVAATAAAYLCFIAIAVFYGVDIYIATCMDSSVFICSNESALDIDITACVDIHISAGKHTLLVLNAMDFC